jgi:hypothetical protein
MRPGGILFATFVLLSLALLFAPVSADFARPCASHIPAAWTGAVRSAALADCAFSTESQRPGPGMLRKMRRWGPVAGLRRSELRRKRRMPGLVTNFSGIPLRPNRWGVLLLRQAVGSAMCRTLRKGKAVFSTVAMSRCGSCRKTEPVAGFGKAANRTNPRSNRPALGETTSLNQVRGCRSAHLVWQT